MNLSVAIYIRPRRPVRGEFPTSVHGRVRLFKRSLKVLAPTVIPESSPEKDRSAGWLAESSVHLFDRSEGSFTPREQVVDCRSYYLNVEGISPLQGREDVRPGFHEPGLHR